jgi:hypothetical protein
MGLDLKPKWLASGASLVIGGLATALIISACGSGNPQLDDLQNVSPSYPNWVGLYLNVDNHPNIVEMCINGVGFATTTRDAAGAITRIPEWDAFCATQEGKKATQNGQP